jgi:recombination protein RecA
MQKDEILKMVVALKAIKLPVSMIEPELGFSNGLIGKAAKGLTELSEDKFKKLEDYFVLKCGITPPIPSTKIVSTPAGLKEKPSNEKMKALKLTIDKIDKDFGKGSVQFLGAKPEIISEAVSTGSIGLDIALGIGGLPQGRIVEIYGPESSGKTTLAISTIIESQKRGGTCAVIDAEHAFDTDYARKLGVNIDDLLISQPDNGEQALEIADRLIGTGSISVIVIDSVAALVPKAELEGEMGDSKMGLQARLMSQSCRKMVATISKTNTICIFINQLRDKIGITWGSPETTTGGNALKFYASVRLDTRKIAQIKDGENILGNRVKVKVVKNKVAPPARIAEFDLIFGEGINKAGELVDIGVEMGIIEKSGSWFSYEKANIGQGRDAICDLLRSNQSFADEIATKIKAAISTKQSA